MLVKIKRHGEVEFVGFSRLDDKKRAKGYLDPCNPLFKIEGYSVPQVISRKDIISDFPIDVWCLVSVDGKMEVRKTGVSMRFKTLGTVYHLSEHNANMALGKLEE
jgi:hypothetical protein